MCTIVNNQIFISGNLEGLNCTEKSVSDLIKALLQVKPDLKKIFKDRPVNLSFISKKTIKELNSEFLKKDKPTNVLSFPSTPEISRLKSSPKFEANVDPFELGDIAIAYEVCKKEARFSKIDFEHHVYHLIVHSVLHLLGYEHEEEKKAAEMEKIEVQVLAKLGINNPYLKNL